MFEHPIVSQIIKTGYPKELSGLENVVQQPECNGLDYFGEEVIEGDEIIIDTENFSEVILKKNLERYLSEICGFKFTQAE